VSLLIAIACEAEADFRAVTTLIDRVLVERIDWLEPEHLERVRRYNGLESTH